MHASEDLTHPRSGPASGAGLDDSIGFLLGAAYRKVSLTLLQQLRDWDITPEQWSMLARICERGGRIQRELGELTGKDKPTTTRILELLEAKGLIVKQPDPKDRRSQRIHATAQGERLLAETRPVERKALDIGLRALTEEDRAQLRQLLQRIVQPPASSLAEAQEEADER
ncbi:MarR family winged helix-turn-helix transcriptional regulator [Paenibacillus sp. B01]|uniref:MarR family winged helix-turn-helix transcriptional regulator n=1 Tax=Paenibacillus sp. B01 TaxID=2660554 RepID=UPI00129A904C|nr:MarR family winged helix-turn-helix transcriptional regulator [Paenibacillus sp. B01]QGG55118.1 MarR family transcriptional regulator [Paenibacillus sp. B01]